MTLPDSITGACAPATALAPLDPPFTRVHLTTRTVAVLGLGYVGLPTALAFTHAGLNVVGVDISEHRLDRIRRSDVDLLPADRQRLSAALDSATFHLTTDAAALGEADAVLICVPTPITGDCQPDLTLIERACHTAVMYATAGQTIILTSTSYVGTTRDLLALPLRQRGFAVGEDVFVAFAPERIDPGVAAHDQASVPRVLGGMTPACAARAAEVLAPIAPRLHTTSSCEAAEMTKLYENTFRAVNIALANEMAAASAALGLDVIEVTAAAATKPFGFMAHLPGAGVGGHCIPCDPHYLLWSLRAAAVPTPVIAHAMDAIHARPVAVADRAVALLREAGIAPARARVLLVGIAYKPDVADVRESPALTVLHRLEQHGVTVAYHDSRVETVTVDGDTLTSVARPDGGDYDLAVVLTRHANDSLPWLAGFGAVLDCTYREPHGSHVHRIEG